MTLQEKAERIIEDIQKEDSCNPVSIFEHMVQKEYINMHGPEHHILDGACILMAFYNAGGKIDLKESLEKLMYEGLRMPGAMCGLWGVCGAVTSIGAALSIIDHTGPLSTDGSWGEHMEFTSSTVSELGKVNGPRCCKRDGKIALKKAVEYINSHYEVCLEYTENGCIYSDMNAQCIELRCPFYD